MGGKKTRDWLTDRREDIQTANYSGDAQQAIIDFLDAYNPDKFRLKPPLIEGKDRREDTLEASSRLAYASTLHRTAQWVDLTECTGTELNEIAQARLDGRHHSAKDDGLSQNTIHQNQIAWRSFAQFHENHPQDMDIPLDSEDIILIDRDETSVDERDMFDPEEIEAMRNASRNKRDRALLELLIYTGQRHNALRFCRVKDIQPDEGESGKLYIREDIDGMKGADGSRPLLGAQKACREWKRSHPTGNPDHAFITHICDWSGKDSIDPGDPLSKQSFGDTVKRIAKRAGVQKPANPHQFRHYFVTMAISKHGMSFDTVRHLIGHAPGSRELERTYQHLVDEDYIENAELDMGIREQREESLTPEVCPTCDRPLNPDYEYCPSCGMTFSPKAEQIKDDANERKAQAALEATDEETKEKVRIFMDKLDDPEALNQLSAIVEELGADSIKDADESL